MVFWARDGGSTLLSRGPVVVPDLRGGRVDCFCEVRRMAGLLVLVSVTCEGWWVDAIAVVVLTGALPRVRTGAVRASVVLSATVPVIRVLEVHLPPAQVGVVLAGGVRAGTEVVTNSGAREPMLL